MITTPYGHYKEMDLDKWLEAAFPTLGVRPQDAADLKAFMAPLRIKNPDHYYHSIRVAILACDIAGEMGLSCKAMFFAGLCHDVGKALVPASTLNKTEGWTAADSETMKTHVNDGHRLLRDRFDFTADIMHWHHRFQKNCYPLERPAPLHSYGNGTEAVMVFYGRLLALADVFDALHRQNPKKLTGAEIKEAMFKHAPDLKDLVERLYEKGVFPIHDV